MSKNFFIKCRNCGYEGFAKGIYPAGYEGKTIICPKCNHHIDDGINLFRIWEKLNLRKKEIL